MEYLVLSQCQIGVKESQNKYKSHLVWDELVLSLSSFPDKMGGKLQNQNSELFYPNQYIGIICKSILNVLKDVHTELKNNISCSLEFISRLIGKLCLTGYADLLWNYMIPVLSVYIKEDYLWCRICERIVTGVPDKSIESVLVPLLQKISWFKLVAKFLGDCILTNKKVQYLLCTKLLFHRYFEETKLLENIIGYLASSHTRRHLYLEVMRNLLNVWGDSSAIKHTSYSQHYFISRALMISLAYLTEKEKVILKDEYIRILMKAVECHIGSPDYKLRSLGMVVAETITSTLDPTGPKLQFEVLCDVKFLSVLEIFYREIKEESKNESIIKTEETRENIKEEKQHEELDRLSPMICYLYSDDDLEPYDMSNDVKTSKAKTPKYIRDCMEGLIGSEDGDKVESCLFSAESLIRRSPDGLQEIAGEFSKILLHLQDNFCTPGFIAVRFGAMVALAVHCPVEVSEYLTSQFYEKNYNLRQRMDILEVLSAAAQELAKPVDKSKVKEKPKVEEIKPNLDPESWREIVDKRIESKTRRFIKGRSKPEPVAVANRFAPVAGNFFFPLLRFFDRKESSFDLLGEDCVVLRKMVFSLGIILYSAIHIPLAQQMCRTLLEFIWAIRFHTDSSVRQAILFSTSMIILVLPSYCIMSELQGEMMETKSWLEDIVDKDPDTECKKMALQALVLLQNTIKQVRLL
ncbi:hypothetical protein LOTGIDRAFT_135529 [Lottia gigantea]|uniref:Uncharacterized protein n=1 Tax=Lottia gigantea TaxID=225164 RepID=V4B199_LOTGI|nr:hypothetical protein LOTGIDRAFT_135529 [Lottia gigantea]ESO81979.1 hypothetical protein LOTGIDRAFT_135529 [Lottia gigantea]